METAIAPIGPAFFVVPTRVRAQQDAAGLEGRGEVTEDPGELADRYVEQRGVRENPVEAGEWQIKREEVLMQHLTIRFSARDTSELARAVQTYRLVAECFELAQIPAGATA